MKKAAVLLLALILCLPLAALGETKVITLTCTGDTMPGANDLVWPESYSYARYIEKYGYGYPFEKMLSLTANDDITLVNLECVLNDDAPATTSRLRFRGPKAYAQVLSFGSVEVANMANNHYSDYGKAGYLSTKAALEAVGIQYCGSTEYGNDTCIVEVDGIKIGFVGVLPLYHKDHAADVQRCFDRLKEAGCEVIVASLHCGAEYNTIHGNIHDSYGKTLRRYGANLIIGNHPHVPQGVTVRDGVTQIYSLGNFTFGGNTGVDEEVHCLASTVAQFKLYFEDGKYTGHQMTLYPIHISGVTPENNYQPVLVEGEEAQKIMRRVQRDSDFYLLPYVDGQGAVQKFVPWEK